MLQGVRVRIPPRPPDKHMAEPARKFSPEGGKCKDVFGILEKAGDVRQTERFVTPVNESSPIDIDRLVRQFIFLRTGDRSGSLREPEATYMNCLVRAIRNGNIPDRGVFFAELKRRVLRETLPGKEWVEHEGRRVQLGQRVEHAAMGIEAVLDAVSRLSYTFREKMVRPADLKQMIGMNDYLDAVHKIDLIEMHYQPRPTGIDVRLVRFIQVKRGAKLLSENERAAIALAHQEYLRGVSPVVFAQKQRRREAEAYVEEGEYFRQELQANGETFTDLRRFLEGYFEPIMVALFDGPDDLEDPDIEQIMAASAGEVHPTVAKLFFAKSDAKDFLTFFGVGVGEQPERVERLAARLVGWAVRNSPSTSELRALNPVWKNDAELVAPIRFESVIIENGVETAVPLEAPEPLALTRRKR